MNSNCNLISNSCSRRLRWRGLSPGIGLAALLFAAGCDSHRLEPAESGEVMLSVGTIPDDVACVRVVAAGEFRQVVTDFDVTSGATLGEALSGLPVGKVLFSANAYAQDCASTTKSTAPMWLSDEKSVNVVQGKSTSVTLTLYKNGRAKVTVEFADQEDGGTDAGGSADGGL
jgi:hypothetical protein